MKDILVEGISRRDTDSLCELLAVTRGKAASPDIATTANAGMVH